MKKTICRFTGVVVVERSCHKWISELLACDSETHLEFGVKLRDPAIEHAHGGQATEGTVTVHRSA